MNIGSIQGMSRPRDVSSKGHIVQGTHRTRIMFGETSVGNTSSWHLIACVCGERVVPLTSYSIIDLQASYPVFLLDKE